jgi:indole-3-glycerol phosphate synthase
MNQATIDISKYQGKVLEAIMATKRLEVAKARSQVPVAELKDLARVARTPQDFAAALTHEPGTSVIAEVKKASPSRGLIAREWDPAEMALAYVRGGAVAISCLTDVQYFQGKLSFLELIGQRLEESGCPVPVLRKDFLFDPYQVWETRAAGADAFLLIMSVLTDREYRDLVTLAHNLDMQVLVEVHDEEEMDRALLLERVVIGVNNRNLRTFQTDIENTRRLRQLVPQDRVLVGESGMKNPKDVQVMAEIGCDAILVGESFSRSPQSQRERKVREFVMAGSRVEHV